MLSFISFSPRQGEGENSITQSRVGIHNSSIRDNLGAVVSAGSESSATCGDGDTKRSPKSSLGGPRAGFRLDRLSSRSRQPTCLILALSAASAT